MSIGVFRAHTGAIGCIVLIIILMHLWQLRSCTAMHVHVYGSWILLGLSNDKAIVWLIVFISVEYVMFWCYAKLAHAYYFCVVLIGAKLLPVYGWLRWIDSLWHSSACMHRWVCKDLQCCNSIITVSTLLCRLKLSENLVDQGCTQ